MAYDPRVINALLRIGRRRGVGQEAILGALATGIVETGLRNLPGGHADSEGWRQERRQFYPNPRNLRASINRFYDEWEQHDRPGFNPGLTAANVQRPAEQYRGRYADVMDEARRILSGRGGGGVGNAGNGGPVSAPGVGGLDLFEVLRDFNQNTMNPDDPIEASLQRGWDLLAQLSSGSGQPVDTSLGAGLVPRRGGGKGVRGNSDDIFELFYDPIGQWDSGRWSNKPLGGHQHVHVGAPTKVLRRIARLADRKGLSVREFAPYDKVDPVHTGGSFHYSNQAADISGTDAQERWLVRTLRRRFGLR